MKKQIINDVALATQQLHCHEGQFEAVRYFFSCWIVFDSFEILCMLLILLVKIVDENFDCGVIKSSLWVLYIFFKIWD
jgi:hypothetical protein